MKISYELRIGILATITLVILIVGYKFLKGSNLLDNNKTYYVYFDNVQQLDPSAPVFTRGIKVGTVIKVVLAENNPDRVVVTLDVKGNIKLPKNAKAVLISTGVIGGKAIDLRFDHHCTDDCIENRGTIESDIESILSSMLPKDELDAYIQSLGKSVQKTLDSTDKKGQINMMANDIKSTLSNLHLITAQLAVFMTANTQQITSTISGLNTLSKSLSANAKNIDQSLNNLTAITNQLKNADLGKLVQNSDQTIQSLQKTTQEATKSLQKVNELISNIQNGTGSASKLINNPDLYNNLESMSKNLDKLLIDLKANPHRYLHFSVFSGKKEKTETK